MLFNLSGFSPASEAAKIFQKKKIEPRSVLDQRSPSPQTSSSTGGGSANSAYVAAPWTSILLEEAPIPHDSASELPPIPSALEIGALEWEETLKDPSFPGFENLPTTLPPINANPSPFLGDFSYLINPNQLQPQNPNFQPSIVEDLVHAAGMIEEGSFSSARGILARLNHPLSWGNSTERAALYCKEALFSAGGGVMAAPPLSPAEFVLKLGAFKSFSEYSPVLHFCHFSCEQTILEEIQGFVRVHVVDFDLGNGSQWSSFMLELSRRKSTLKITGVISSESQPFEVALTRESLCKFAADLGIPFEVNIVGVDFFELGVLRGLTLEGEAVVVNLPSWSMTSGVLRSVKQMKPRAVVGVDFFGGGDLALSGRVIRTVESAAGLMDSIEAAGVDFDSAMKIEKYWVKERMKREMAAPRRRESLTSAGFSPVKLSGYTEVQADRLIKNSRLRGFHVEKSADALTLCWQRRELVSVGAWR